MTDRQSVSFKLRKNSSIPSHIGKELTLRNQKANSFSLGEQPAPDWREDQPMAEEEISPNIILAPIREEIKDKLSQRSRSQSNKQDQEKKIRVSISGVSSDSFDSDIRKAIKQADQNQLFDLPRVEDDSSDFSSSEASCEREQEGGQRPS